MNLNGRGALITGASRGIGKAIALRFADSGADIILSCVSNVELCQEVAEEIMKKGVRAKVIEGDIASSADAQRIVDGAMAELGKIDILVNNAGIINDSIALGMMDEDWTKVINTNLTGTFNMCRAAGKHMMSKRYGRIINISSFVTRFGNRGQANYASSKAGIEALTKVLAVELGPKGITVNAVSPGTIETDMSKDVLAMHKDKILSMIPVKKLGKPENIASLVHYLALEESAYITGEVIGVTGGLGLSI